MLPQRMTHRRSSPADAIHDLLAAGWRAQALRTFVAFGCPQQLTIYGPMMADELAVRVGAVAAALEPVLVALEPFGVVAQTEGHYELGPIGRVLLDGEPDSMATAVAVDAHPLWQEAMQSLHTTIRTGRPPHGGLYGYLDQHPDVAELFDLYMARRTLRTAPAVATHEFGDRVVDLGGGTGIMLAHILRAHPRTTGWVVEREPVAKRATAHLAEQADIQGRWEVIVGDIFAAGDIPSDATDYLAASVLHNLSDEATGVLLATIREVMPPGSRLRLVDMVVPPGAAPDPSRDLGLRMAAMFGAGERRLGQYAALLQKAGFRIAEVAHPLPWGLTLITCISDESDEIEAM
ncbi:methyltransferase [Sphaerisporangium sp. NPDC005288]|uniref:methyltransferase n=1 Tax=Sphaerisporangium sp. NPDC005288 TaxID=3155114 RepID=UPI0033ADDA6A